MSITFLLFSPFLADADPDVDYDECINHVRLAQMDMESYARRFGNMIHYGAKDPADYAAMQYEYAEINKQVGIAQRCATIHNIKFNKNKYFQQQQPHTGAGAGAEASIGHIQNYEQAAKLVRSRVANIKKTSPNQLVGTVKSEQELQALEKELIHGLKLWKTENVPHKGTIRVYNLQGGSKINIRNFSASGGRGDATIDIAPPRSSSLDRIKIHIKQ